MIDPTNLIPRLEDIAIQLNAPVAEGPADALPGFLPRHGVMVLAGQTNVGKSLVGLETISSLVTGNPLWGTIEPTMRAKKVLYILAEHHDGVLQALYQKTQLPIIDQVFLLGPEALGWDKWLVMRGAPNLRAIEKFHKWAEGVDVIVWDPLSAFVVGEGIEQDNVTMRLVLDQMGLIANSAGAACLVLAHQGKPMMDLKGIEHARQSYAIRGASSLEDSATHIHYMAEAPDGPMQKAADGKVFEIRCRKYKGEGVALRRLLRNPDNLTHTLLGEPPISEIQRAAAERKMSRLGAYNRDLDQRTCAKLIAAIDGVPVETIHRHLGWKIDTSS